MSNVSASKEHLGSSAGGDLTSRGAGCSPDPQAAGHVGLPPLPTKWENRLRKWVVLQSSNRPGPHLVEMTSIYGMPPHAPTNTGEIIGVRSVLEAREVLDYEAYERIPGRDGAKDPDRENASIAARRSVATAHAQAPGKTASPVPAITYEGVDHSDHDAAFRQSYAMPGDRLRIMAEVDLPGIDLDRIEAVVGTGLLTVSRTIMRGIEEGRHGARHSMTIPLYEFEEVEGRFDANAFRRVFAPQPDVGASVTTEREIALRARGGAYHAPDADRGRPAPDGGGAAPPVAGDAMGGVRVGQVWIRSAAAVVQAMRAGDGGR